MSLKLEFKKQSDINKLVEFLKQKVELEDVERHVTEEGRFWIRFDKQKAFAKEIVLGDEDTIQLKGKVAAFPAKRENAIAVIKEKWAK